MLFSLFVDFVPTTALVAASFESDMKEEIKWHFQQNGGCSGSLEKSCRYSLKMSLVLMLTLNSLIKNKNYRARHNNSKNCHALLFCLTKQQCSRRTGNYTMYGQNFHYRNFPFHTCNTQS